MARCGCTDACTCVVIGANGVTVTGAGTAGDPYVINPPVVAPSTGGSILEVNTLTADTTIDDTYDVVLVDSETPAAPVEVTLPLVVTAGKVFHIKDYGSGGAGFTQTQAVTINPNGNNIDGLGAIITFPTDGDSLTIVGTGSDWAVI